MTTEPSSITAQLAGNIAENIATIRRKIEAARADSPASAGKVVLIAVSKAQPPERIDAALAAGQRIFGENRVQEAEARWRDRRAAHPDLDLHLVGPLQTNKVRQAVALFDAIQSVDRPKLARALAAEMEKTGRRLPVFLQINTGEEDQKSGVPPREADAFVGLCRDELGLTVKGLMCIPPAEEDPAPHFALLRSIADRNVLPGLSMGMSGDYETAVRLGATHVRVGTAVFGARGDWRETV